MFLRSQDGRCERIPTLRLVAMCCAHYDGAMVTLAMVVMVTTVAGERRDGRGDACHLRPAERKLDDRGAQPQGQRGMMCTNFNQLLSCREQQIVDRAGFAIWEG